MIQDLTQTQTLSHPQDDGFAMSEQVSKLAGEFDVLGSSSEQTVARLQRVFDGARVEDFKRRQLEQLLASSTVPASH